MSSTYTDLLRIEQQATGENANTWGIKENNSLDMLEDAIAGMATVGFTNVDVTLTANNAAADQSRMAIIQCTGTLSANVNAIIPSSTKIYLFWNNTTGNFTLTVKTAAGTGVVIPSGSKIWVMCDGTNAYAGIDAISTVSATMNFVDKTLQRPVLRDYGETCTTNSSSGTSATLDLTNGNVFDVTLTGNCTFTFSNPPGSGTGGSFTLILRQDGTGGRTVTWPASVDWPNSAAPTLTTSAGSVAIFAFSTVTAGSVWWGFLAGDNMG